MDGKSPTFTGVWDYIFILYFYRSRAFQRTLVSLTDFISRSGRYVLVSEPSIDSSMAWLLIGIGFHP